MIAMVLYELKAYESKLVHVKDSIILIRAVDQICF